LVEDAMAPAEARAVAQQLASGRLVTAGAVIAAAAAGAIDMDDGKARHRLAIGCGHPYEDWSNMELSVASALWARRVRNPLARFASETIAAANASLALRGWRLVYVRELSGLSDGRLAAAFRDGRTRVVVMSWRSTGGHLARSGRFAVTLGVHDDYGPDMTVDSVSRGYPERVESDADVRAFLGVGDALLVQFETYVLEAL